MTTSHTSTPDHSTWGGNSMATTWVKPSCLATVTPPPASPSSGRTGSRTTRSSAPSWKAGHWRRTRPLPMWRKPSRRLATSRSSRRRASSSPARSETLPVPCTFPCHHLGGCSGVLVMVAIFCYRCCHAWLHDIFWFSDCDVCTWLHPHTWDLNKDCSLRVQLAQFLHR